MWGKSHTSDMVASPGTVQGTEHGIRIGIGIVRAFMMCVHACVRGYTLDDPVSFIMVISRSMDALPMTIPLKKTSVSLPTSFKFNCM